MNNIQINQNQARSSNNDKENEEGVNTKQNLSDKDIEKKKETEKEETEKAFNRSQKVGRTPPQVKIDRQKEEDKDRFISASGTPVLNSAGEENISKDGEIFSKSTTDQLEGTNHILKNTAEDNDVDDWLGCIDLEEQQVLEGKEEKVKKDNKKRGRKGSTPENIYKRSKGETVKEQEFSNFLKLYRKMERCADNLMSLIEQHIYTKNIVKDAVKELYGYKNKTKKIVETWTELPEKTLTSNASVQTQQQKRINLKTLTKTLHVNEFIPEKQTKEIGVQVNFDMEEETIKNREELLEQVADKTGNWNVMEQIISKQWSEEVYVNTVIEIGNPTKQPEKQDLAVIFDPDKENHKFNITEEKHIDEIIQNKLIGKGKTACLTSRKDLEITGENSGTTQEMCTYFIGADVSEGLEPSLLQACNKLKELMSFKKRDQAAIICDAELLTEKSRKIVECAFAETNVKLTLFDLGVLKKTNNTEGWSLKEKKTIKNYNTNALIIQAKGKSYADLLREVKGKVDAKDVKDAVRDLKKTRNGDLLITLKKEEDAIKLQEIITKKLNNQDIRQAGKLYTTVYINDLDAVISREEIKEAIGREVGMEGFEIKALKEVYGGRQVATVIMEDNKAQKLLEIGTIKVSWSSCRVREKVVFEKCFKCWRYGHRAQNCRGPDREDRCKKCGGYGHKMPDCKSDTEYCWTCENEGHRDFQCPKYKKALRQEIRKTYY